MKKLVLLSLCAMLSTAAFAKDTTCNGTINNRNIAGNVKVTQHCNIMNSKINGNITVQKNAILIVKNSRINGNLESKSNFKKVTAIGNSIDGNVQLQGGQVIALNQNRINGNVKLKQNRHNVVVKMNQIKGNLQCDNNTQRPITVKNRVNGNAQGQCR